MVFDQSSYNNQDNSIYSFIKNIISSLNSCFPVKIVQVNSGTIDVVPLFGLVDTKKQPIEPPRINNIKYIKGQSSSYGVNVSPKVGDEGIVIFCSRDISRLDATMPSSPRTFDLADAIYIGLIQSSSELSCYMDVQEKNIKIEAPESISIKSNTLSIKANEITMNFLNLTMVGNVNISGKVDITGSLVVNGVDFSKHTHSTPSGESGVPK